MELLVLMTTFVCTSSTWLLCGLATYIWGMFFAARESLRDPWRGWRVETAYFFVVLLLGPILPLGLMWEYYFIDRDC